MAGKSKKDGRSGSNGGDDATKSVKLELGQRYWMVDKPSVDPPAAQGAISSFVAMATLGLFLLAVPLVMFILPLACLITRSTKVIMVTVGIWSTVLLPATRHWDAFMNSWLFKTWREYFRFSLILSHEIDTKRKYVIAESPHGVFPMGPIVAGSCVDDCFPGMRVQAVSASNVFRVPLLKHFMTWIGCAPATKANFLKLLDNTDSCAVVVGGVAEMYMQEPDRECIKLATRTGFIKVALQTGSDLLPVYHFGNTKCVDIIGKSLKNFSRKLRASFLLPYGRFFLPIPYRTDIMMAMGKPVRVEKAMDPEDDGFDDEVKRLQKAYLEAITATFEEHKATFGWDDVPLEIS